MRDRRDDSTHRRVAESKIGRSLAADEVAHHLDEDKENNASANIAVEKRGPHTAAHNRGRRVSALRKSLRMVREQRKLY